MSPTLDTYTADYLQETSERIAKIPVMVFLCGPGMGKRQPGRGKASSIHLRAYIRSKLKGELKGCDVRMGEHEALIRSFKKVLGRAANLADHEFDLARRKAMDLIVIFPCSPGSFAELGLFCLENSIASKMAVFLDRARRTSKGYITQGPAKAAELRNAKVFYVDYAKRDRVWEKVKDLVLQVKAKKRNRKIRQLVGR